MTSFGSYNPSNAWTLAWPWPCSVPNLTKTGFSSFLCKSTSSGTDDCQVSMILCHVQSQPVGSEGEGTDCFCGISCLLQIQWSILHTKEMHEIFLKLSLRPSWKTLDVPEIWVMGTSVHGFHGQRDVAVGLTFPRGDTFWFVFFCVFMLVLSQICPQIWLIMLWCDYCAALKAANAGAPK